MAFTQVTRVDLPYETLSMARWQGQVMPLVELEAMSDISSLLEEGETLEDLVGGDECAHAWHSTANGVSILALETHGWTYLFTEDGRLDTEAPPAELPLYISEIIHHKLASVLAPVNSPVLGRMFASALGGACESVVEQSDTLIHTHFGNGQQRIVLLDQGRPVSGITFNEVTVDIAYTAQECRRQGWARRAFEAARERAPALEHSDVLTEEGLAYVSQVSGPELT